jgi:predicted aminopeptidase
MLRHWLASLLLLPLLAGCGTGYLLQAGRGEWQLLRARVPINRLLISDATAPNLKAQLREAQAAREFAVRVLQLPDNASYRSFAALQRPYVVWNVVAAPEFSTAPMHWCFPFTGCIAYRGYFREADARRYAARLHERGLDTQVAGVAAFSTLGKFADPVLDTMLPYGDVELAGTVFHELAHQRVYIKGDTAFNEAFAMAVEQAGLAAWLQYNGQDAQLARIGRWRSGIDAISDWLAAGRERLAGIYAQQALTPAEMRSRKAAQFALLAAGVLRLEREHGISSVYGEWARAGLNNAHLAAVATYHACVPAFLRLLQTNDGDWPRFYGAVQELGRATSAGRRRFCTAGGESGTEPDFAGGLKHQTKH